MRYLKRELEILDETCDTMLAAARLPRAEFARGSYHYYRNARQYLSGMMTRFGVSAPKKGADDAQA